MSVEEEVVDLGNELEPAKVEEAEKVTDKLDDALETDEEKVEREKLEAEEERKARIRIPKARFDEAMEKARAREAALNQKIQSLERDGSRRTQEADVSKAQQDIDTLQDKYEDLILDGKKDEARTVRRQVEALRAELMEYQTSTKSEAAKRAAVAELKYDVLLERVEEKHPELNPDSDSFDESKTAEVAMLMEAFAGRGVARNAALTKAIEYVFGKETAAAPPGSDAATKARAEAARRKAAVADGKQPPNMGKTGLDSDKAGGKPGDNGVDIMRMSQKQFAKIDEEALARLRGDVI